MLWFQWCGNSRIIHQNGTSSFVTPSWAWRRLKNASPKKWELVWDHDGRKHGWNMLNIMKHHVEHYETTWLKILNIRLKIGNMLNIFWNVFESNNHMKRLIRLMVTEKTSSIGSTPRVDFFRKRHVHSWVGKINMANLRWLLRWPLYGIYSGI